MRERAIKLKSLTDDLIRQSELVACSGSPSDQYEFIENATEVIAKVLYVYNLDDDFLGEVNKLLEDLPSAVKPNVESVQDAFYYTKDYLIPRLSDTVGPWLDG